MAKENAILNEDEILNEEFTESFDFDELEEKLQSQLEEEFADILMSIQSNNPKEFAKRIRQKAKNRKYKRPYEQRKIKRDTNPCLQKDLYLFFILIHVIYFVVVSVAVSALI